MSSRAAINIIPGKAPLDESYYNLDDDELVFYKSQTGIADERALKEHISAVQADAYEVRSQGRRLGPYLVTLSSICG